MTKIRVDFTTEEIAVICRALSHSMNYRNDGEYYAKWNLRLKLEEYQMRSENKKRRIKSIMNFPRK